MRVGPRRFTSTAASSGESNDTVAAEWMTTSHAASAARPSSSSARPSVPTSPAIGVTRSATIGGEAVLAELLAQAVEGVVAEDLALGALLDRGAAARAG